METQILVQEFIAAVESRVGYESLLTAAVKAVEALLIDAACIEQAEVLRGFSGVEDIGF